MKVVGNDANHYEHYPKGGTMALSARNIIRGKIKEIKKGQVMAEVIVEIATGVEIVSAITTSSVERLGLTVGKSIEVVIKATSVMINA